MAQVLDSLTVGGAEQLAVRIANGRARRGAPSFVYVLRHDGPLRANVEPEVVVRLLGVERSSIRNPLRFLASLRAGRRRLREQLTQDGVRVIQSHLPNPNFWALLLALAGDVAAVPTVHNNREFSYGATDLRSRLNRWAYRIMLARCGAVVACSEEVARSLLTTLGLARAQRLVAVPNGVEIPPPAPAEVNAAVRARHGLPADAPLVLAAGRLSDQKNFKVLVDAAADLRPRWPDLQIVIAGEGELRDDLARRVAERGLDKTVRLPGNLMDLPELMAAADVFVLPSRFEGLPLVLLEAMARGLPVVASDIKGVSEVVRDGASAVLCPVDDAAALGAGIATYLADEGRRRRDGGVGRDLVAANYGIDRVLDQLDAVFADIVT